MTLQEWLTAYEARKGGENGKQPTKLEQQAYDLLKAIQEERDTEIYVVIVSDDSSDVAKVASNKKLSEVYWVGDCDTELDDVSRLSSEIELFIDKDRYITNAVIANRDDDYEED